ncbi:MAG: PKD domain-containing protein, partial [Bacteroidia bacterium]|nr:PKD domain-containing protein [Bacteroidia bacterium]
MKQTLQTKLRRIGKRVGLTILAFAALSVSAQMSGSYTIQSGTATATNFTDWTSFSQALQGITRNDGGATPAGGISGNVTVDVLSSLTADTTVRFPQVAGMSSYSITINGNSNTLTYAKPYEVISFTGADYVKITGLTIVNSHPTNAIGIRFSNASDYNTIDKCNIQFSGITTSTTAGTRAYIAFAASNTAISTASTVSNGSFNTISGCNMKTTNSNSPGPGYGISVMGNTSNYTSTASNNTISGNTIENFAYMGIVNFYGNGNQINNNDISRKNATSYNCNSTLIGIYSVYNYSTSRQLQVNSNNIHDLPHVGAVATSAPTTVNCTYLWYNYGTTNSPFQVDKNTIQNIYCNGNLYMGRNDYNQNYEYTNNYINRCFVPISTSRAYANQGVYSYGSLNYKMNGNVIENCQGGYYFYGLRNEYPNTSSTLAEMNDNTIQNNSKSYYYVYALRAYYTQNNAAYPVKIQGNKILNNSADYYYVYCIYNYYYGNYDISRNIIAGNKNSGTVGYVYGIYSYQNYNTKINSNLIHSNGGYYGTYGIYSYYGSSNNYSFECRQNTVQMDGSNSGYAYHDGYGLQLLNYYHPNQSVVGNIIDIQNSYGATMSANSYVTPNAFTQWDYNTYHYKNISYQYWNAISGSATDFAGWKGLGLCGKNEYFADPKFRNKPTDWSSDIFEDQNNVPTVASNPLDLLGNPRNVVKSDRGAVESTLDIEAVSTNFTVPASVCAGYEVSGGTTITVKSKYLYDTAYNFNVAYAVNGGPKTTEMVTSKLLNNGQATVTFSKGLKLNQVGTNRIAIFIDIPDDVRSNDSFIFNTTVKPAPGGAKWNFSATPTKTIYQVGKPNDVTIIGEKVIYDMNPPRAYSNTDYNTNWTATAYATTSNGASISGATITKNPSASNSLEYTFQTSNASLEDSMITLYLKVTDLTNGCDTIVKRNVLIYPTIKPDFTFPAKICNGDLVEFDNTSTVKSGNMEFEWDFGTGNPNDITSAPNPVFVFPTLGNFTVTMKARTLPYGFEVSKSYTVTVSPIPTVKFTKQNACEGLDLVFTNQTTPSNSTYVWSFGDNTTSTLTSPTKKYAQTGQYTVTLKANLNGCIAELSQRAYQFDKPKANFNLLSGSCDNDNFVFENTSTIKNGLFGNSWDFNDGTVSTEDAPSHMFTSAGAKNVKLTTTSEFGCTDSKTLPINVNESPKADFTNDPACSLTPTTFTNTTPVAGSPVKTYAWDFGDGTTSPAMSPVKSWTALGPKAVMMTVTLNNGCKSTITKNLSVGVQPNVVFNAQNVCAGDPVVFENNTGWAQGDIAFNWNFGDNTTSTNSDPQHVYTTSVTKTYNVTLKASIAGGCEAELTKPVTVNQGPTTCDFMNAPDYGFGFYGMKFDPINGGGNQQVENGVTYTWVFDGGGTQKGGTTSYNFQEDGSYQVTMRARV